MNVSLTRLGIAVVTTMALAACSPAGSGAPTSTPATAAATPTVAPSAAPTPKPTGTPRPTPVIVIVTPIPDAPDSGLVVELVADQERWDTYEIVAPAGMVWHVRLDHQDAADEVHNFVVASGLRLEERIFTSDRFYSGTISTFAIPALPAGAYFFICTIHPDSMRGDLAIK